MVSSEGMRMQRDMKLFNRFNASTIRILEAIKAMVKR